ncbi:hypothetical protein HanRHA438_Chr17g0812101 [Helianthus annuus]|nr:hypothetical protein HanRHA438_Chr17g0812101 [Helianthus annuus]
MKTSSNNLKINKYIIKSSFIYKSISIFVTFVGGTKGLSGFIDPLTTFNRKP